MSFSSPTPCQIAANRRNAARSTGPTSVGGAARASYNALRHGLYTKDVVLMGEDRDAYDQLLVNLGADLHPKGPVEEGLVRRIADIWWRLGRMAAIEAGLLSPDWSGDPRAAHKKTGGGPLIDGFRVALDEAATLDRLGRYEGRLERALARTMGLFSRMRDGRLRGARKNVKKRKKTVTKKSAP